MPKKPDDMTDEMWAAVCIVMEDKQISSWKEMTESHKAMVQRMDDMETKWSESQAAKEVDSEPAGEPVAQATGGAGTGAEGGGVTPPPVVEKTGEGGEGEEKKGSGRGGKPRWYERDGYAK